MSKWVAVITGASSGIGYATAEEFARQGWSLYLLARRKEMLEGLVKELSAQYPEQHFEACPCDVTSYEDVERVAGKIAAPIHLVLNNAGAFEYQSLEKTTAKNIDQMIDVNLRGVVYVTKAFLPQLKKTAASGQRTKVISVSSVGGLWGFNNMVVYTATKFAVVGFSSALRRELAKDGIQVATIYPGPVNTKVPAGTKPPKRGITMLPQQIARQVHELATGDAKEYISHPALKWLALLERISPRLVDEWFQRITR